MRFAIRLLLIEKLPGWCTSSSRSATFRVRPNFKSRISYKIKKMQEHEDISDDNFALVTKQRRGKKNQKKQFSKPRDYSRREVVQLLNCDVLAPNSMIPNFYKDTTAVDTTYTKVIDLKHPSSIQNHLLNEENFHHLKFIVAKTSALQGHYYIGDETGSMKWDATSSGSFFGYFPLGSIIETKKWKNGFIILQIKYKSLNEFGGLKFYHPICNLVINKEQFSNQFIQTPVLEPSAAVLHSCGVIAISRQTGKVLIGRKIHTNHYEECLNALEHHFSERKIHKYVPFRSSFLCNKRALTTWSTKELSKIAHYLPKYTKKGVKDEKWRKFWMFDEVLMNLSQLADEELQRRIEISDHRDGSCWAVPSTTSAYKIENKRYCLESHLETAARAFFYETGTHIHLTMDTKHIDIKSPALVEDNCCFDRYFIHFIHDDGLNLEGHKKRSFDSWQWVDIDDEEQNGMYGEYVSCILKSISAK